MKLLKNYHTTLLSVKSSDFLKFVGSIENICEDSFAVPLLENSAAYEDCFDT